MDNYIDKDIRDLKLSANESIELQLIKEIKALTKAIRSLYWELEHEGM